MVDRDRKTEGGVSSEPAFDVGQVCQGVTLPMSCLQAPRLRQNEVLCQMYVSQRREPVHNAVQNLLAAKIQSVTTFV